MWTVLSLWGDDGAIQVPLMLLLGIWCAVPVVVGDSYPWKAVIMLALEGLAVIAYYLGTQNPLCRLSIVPLAAIGQRKEWMVFVKVYGFLMALLAAEVGLLLSNNHDCLF